MSRRQQRVEELLRREIAQMLLRGELRDPRLNPNSAVIPVQRPGGVTSAVAVPIGGLVAGQSAWFDLDNPNGGYAEILKPSVAMHIVLGEQGSGVTGGSRAGTALVLRELFDDVAFYKKKKKNFDDNRARKLHASRLDLEALIPVMDGEFLVQDRVGVAVHAQFLQLLHVSRFLTFAPQALCEVSLSR